jgi:hypothetical protein
MRKALCVLALGLAEAGPVDAQAAQGQGASVPAVAQPSDGSTIIVKRRRPSVSRTIDSSVYDVKNNAQAQAGSGADVLNTVPSVHVTADGALSVRGDGNVQLYVNGKPASATGSATILQAMSGEAIASVEVITNPSAKYDANGGAIVNLILKKGGDAGLHATLTANAGDQGRANGTLNASYGGKRLSGNVSVALRDDVRFTRILNDRIVRSAEDGAIRGRSTRQADYTPTHSKALNLEGSAIYTLTTTADLGTDFSFSHASPKNRVFEHRVDYDPAGAIVSDYDRVRGGTYFGHSADASIYYQDRGSDGHGSLRVVAQLQSGSVRSDRPFLLYPTVPVGPETAQRFYNGSFTQQQRLSVDYGHPARKGIRFSVGSELKRDTLRFENGVAAISPQTADRLGPPPIASVYDVTKATAAIYVTLEARWGRWIVQGGERGQLTRLDFGGTSGTRPADRHISALNHSLSLARYVGSDQIVLKLSRTQQLFDLRDLDPLVSHVDPDSRSVGNPGLIPQEVTSVEGAYDFGQGARSGAITLYYRRARDTLAGYSIFLADNVEVSTRRNFGSAQSYGLEANLSDQLSKTLKFSVTANLFRTQFPQIGDDESSETRSIRSYAGQMSLDWKPDAADDFHLDANAQGPALVPQGEKSGTYVANLVWRHSVSNRLTLSISGQSLLRRTYVRTVLDAPTGRDIGLRLNGGRAVFAGLKYKIH